MIVIHCRSQAHLTRDETKTPSDLGWPQPGPTQGHYYACEDCGWCSSTFYGFLSRYSAQEAGRAHQAAKKAARRERKSIWRKQADGYWTWTRYGIGYSYSCMPGAVLNHAIHAALRRVLHLGQ